MTGAGRSTAAKELEDLGFFVVDNLPPELVGDVVRLVDDKQGVASPWRWSSTSAPGSSSTTLREQLARAVPTRRTRCCSSRPPTTSWSAARRRPAGRTRCRAPGRLLEGITPRARGAGDLRGDADLVIDTTPLNVHQLKDKVARAFGTPEAVLLRITVVSFGFKYGVPVDADLLADMRFLPNPFWVPELRDRDRRGPRRGGVRQGPAGRPGVPGALRAGASRPSATATCARASGS